MVTKGIIKSIDLLGNTCTVHIPLFETAGNDPIVETATISNTPGMYNGYKVGDAVYVAFEDGRMDTPVVIGKLYLGTEKEKADPRGVSNVEESTAAKKATLPADSKLTAEIDSHVPNTTVPYSSLSSIANGLNTLNTNVGQMDRDYGNRFKQVFSDAAGLESKLEQTAENINANVVHKYKDGSADGFGWDLNNNSWTIKAYDQTKDEGLPEDGLDIFKITRDTVEINTPNVRLAGYPRVNTVRYAYGTANTYPDLYNKEDIKSVNDEDINLDGTGVTGWTVTELPYKADSFLWQWTQTAKYQYSESNGESNETWTETIDDNVVKLAINDNLATVNNSIADTLAVAQGKTTNYYSSTDPVNDPSNDIKKGDCWFQTISSDDENYNKELNDNQGRLYQWNGLAWEDIGGELVANKLTANYINALDITAKQITILTNPSEEEDDENNPAIFKADGLSDPPSVTIGGFTVTADRLASGDKREKTLIEGQELDGVYIGPDGISIGPGFMVEAGKAPIISNIQLTDAQKAELKGKSVVSTTKFYCHVNKNFTAVDMSRYKPTTKDPSEMFPWWQLTPPDFVKDYNYWEIVRTIYDDNGTETFEWSKPVKNSMLTVDFINSLGITAEKITVVDPNDSSNAIFKAGLDDSNQPEIFLGGWEISKDGSDLNMGWVFRAKEDKIVSETLIANEFSFEYGNFDEKATYEKEYYESTDKTLVGEKLTGFCFIPSTEREPYIISSSNESLSSIYIFYYMCTKGFRFRICKTADFDDVQTCDIDQVIGPAWDSTTYKYYETVIKGTVYFDFDLLQIGHFDTPKKVVKTSNGYIEL